MMTEIDVILGGSSGYWGTHSAAESRELVMDYVREGENLWIFFDHLMVQPPSKRIIPKSRYETALEEAVPIDLFEESSRVMVLPGIVGGRAPIQILVIGAGGIGSLLVEHVARVATFSPMPRWWVKGQTEKLAITLMDGDIVEERNLPHQRFRASDVGKPKVEAIVRQLRNIGITKKRGVELLPVAENFSADTDLSKYDLVVVAVDREEPRNLVHANAEHWLDLRARGDGFVMCSHETDPRVFEALPKLPEGESASCQLEDAIETGNIQFGFAEAASHGAQWVIQWLRGAQVPQGRTYTIHMGELQLPEFPEEAVE